VDARLHLAALSMVAGCIHAVVAVPHFSEYAVYGSLFTALATFQLAWGAWIYGRPSRPAYRLGIAVSTAVILVWAISRTTGLPLGPDSGQAEAVGPLDPAASAIEAAIVLLCAGLLRAGDPPPSSALAIPVRYLRPLVLVVMVGGMLALFLGGAHHYH
jgi:hypothetical protein